MKLIGKVLVSLGMQCLGIELWFKGCQETMLQQGDNLTALCQRGTDSMQMWTMNPTSVQFNNRMMSVIGHLIGNYLHQLIVVSIY
jgi:hypothetical protein